MTTTQMPVDRKGSPITARVPRRSFLEQRYRFYPLIAVIVIVVAWHFFVLISGVKIIYLPSPLDVFNALGVLLTEDNLIGQTLITLGRIYGGFAIAAVAGIGAGILMNISPGFRSLADAFIGAFYPLPKIALIPLLIIWMGSGESYKLVISAVSAFFPIVVNTYLGVRLIDSGLIKAARDLGLSGAETQRKIVLPGALPSILAGLHLGLGVAVVMIVAAEMVASNNGIGFMLLYAGQLLQTESVFALLVVLTILGWTITEIQKRLDRVVAPWAADES